MSVEISAENRQEYQAWTPVEEDLEGLPKNIHDLILQMRVDCSTTDRNRMPITGQTMISTNSPTSRTSTMGPEPTNSTSTFHMTQ